METAFLSDATKDRCFADRADQAGAAAAIKVWRDRGGRRTRTDWLAACAVHPRPTGISRAEVPAAGDPPRGGTAGTR